MAELAILILLAIVAQFLIDRIKAFLPKKVGGYELIPLYAVVLGLILAYVTGVDTLSLIGFADTGIVGIIITGLAISGGSEIVHELISKVRSSRDDVD